MEKCIAPSRNLGKSSKNKLESGHEVPSIYTFLNRRKKNIACVRARIQATGPVPKQDFANKLVRIFWQPIFFLLSDRRSCVRLLPVQEHPGPIRDCLGEKKRKHQFSQSRHTIQISAPSTQPKHPSPLLLVVFGPSLNFIFKSKNLKLFQHIISTCLFFSHVTQFSRKTAFYEEEKIES